MTDSEAVKKFISFLMRDALYIIVCLFALLALVWTQGAANEYRDQCNEHWMEQMEVLGCLNPDPIYYSGNFSLGLTVDRIERNFGGTPSGYKEIHIESGEYEPVDRELNGTFTGATGEDVGGIE